MVIFLFLVFSCFVGLNNHHYMHSSKKLGIATTLHKYCLTIGQWPYLLENVPENFETHNIVGEVYEISDQKVMTHLAELEGCVFSSKKKF